MPYYFLDLCLRKYINYFQKKQKAKSFLLFEYSLAVTTFSEKIN